MKKFVETLTQMYEENYLTVKKKIVDQKIPIACFSLENEPDFIENLHAKGVNVSAIISKEKITNMTVTPKIINIRDVSQNLIIFKYIIVKGKLETSFLRIPALRKVPIIIWEKSGSTPILVEMV